VGPQRAVDGALDGADREKSAVAIYHVIVRQFLHQVLVAVPHHDVQPDRQLAFLGERPEDVQSFERTSSVLKTGDALG